MAESLIDGYKSWKKRKEMPQIMEEPEPIEETEYQKKKRRRAAGPRINKLKNGFRYKLKTDQMSFDSHYHPMNASGIRADANLNKVDTEELANKISEFEEMVFAGRKG